MKNYKISETSKPHIHKDFELHFSISNGLFGPNYEHFSWSCQRAKCYILLREGKSLSIGVRGKNVIYNDHCQILSLTLFFLFRSNLFNDLLGGTRSSKRLWPDNELSRKPSRYVTTSKTLSMLSWNGCLMLRRPLKLSTQSATTMMLFPIKSRSYWLVYKASGYHTCV